MNNNFGTYKQVGFGTGVALVMNDHGIGDDIMAMPVIESLVSSGKEVTVFCKEFTRSVWTSLGCKVYPSWHSKGTEEYGFGTIEGSAFIGSNFEGKREVFELKNRYEVIYTLNSWSTWESYEVGECKRTPMQLLADLVGVKLPETFDYLKYLKPSYSTEEYIVFAPESVNRYRRISNEKKKYRALVKEYGNVKLLGKAEIDISGKYLVHFAKGLKSKYIKAKFNLHNAWLRFSYKSFDSHKTICKTFEELVSLIYNAKLIVTADNGIMNISRALGKPVVAEFGFSSAKFLAGQYEKYTDSPYKTIQGSYKGCSICNGKGYRGFEKDICLGKYERAKCMDSITVDELLINTKELQWQQHITETQVRMNQVA